MKHTTLILALTGTLALSASAQDAPKKPQRLLLQAQPAAGGALLARPAIAPRGVPLDLSDEQKEKMAEIRKAQSEAFRKIFQNKDLTPQDKRDQYTDLRAEFQKKIEALYTPEQKAKLAEARKEAEKRREQMQKLRVVLTDDQKAELQKLNAKRQEDFKAIRELPQDERRDAYQKIYKQYQEDYQKILTEEQKEKQKKLQELLRGGRNNGAIRILPAGGLRPGLQQVQPRLVEPRRIQPKD